MPVSEWAWCSESKPLSNAPRSTSGWTNSRENWTDRTQPDSATNPETIDEWGRMATLDVRFCLRYCCVASQTNEQTSLLLSNEEIIRHACFLSFATHWQFA